MLEVSVFNERWNGLLKGDPEIFVFDIINPTLKELKVDYYNINISVALADDNLLHQLNLKFRKIDKPTNVLAFPYEKLYSQHDIGDIAIAIDTIERESHKYCIPILTHTRHMLVHGLLHLLGFDHKRKNERVIMKNLESKILNLLEFPNGRSV